MKGARLPTLAARIADPATAWTAATVANWYGQGPRAVEVASGTAVWYRDDADTTLAHVAGEMRAVATIPPRRSRTVRRDCDAAAYKERHQVACCIGTLKYFRRISSRFDKYARRFLAVIHLASIAIRLR